MKKCPHCAEQVQNAATVCKHCGRDIPPPGPAELAAQQKAGQAAGIGCLIIIIIVVLIAIFGHGSGSGGSVTGTATWLPVDTAHGYALVTLTNSGSEDATATCTVEATTDFGDMGFDSMVGENIPAGQTVTAKFPLTIQNESAFKVTSVTVKDC